MNAFVKLAARGRGFTQISLAVLASFLCPSAGHSAESAPADKAAGDAKKDSGGEDYRNWLDVSVGGAFLEGNRAEYQKQQQLPRNAFGGVQDFHYEQDLGKKGLFKVDGRGIFDNHDYSLSVEVSHPDIGYLRGGYQEFRTWYNGGGGFFPQNGQWLTLYDPSLALDRGEVWIQGGLTLPNKPQVSLEYRHQFREGVKDSSSWGLTDLTGGFGLRGIVPSFLTIDEKTDIFAADVKHTVGKTDLALGLRYELTDNKDSRNVRQQPGEGATADRAVTQHDNESSDMFNAHASTETRLNEKTVLTTGYSFTTLNSDVSGSRIYGPGYDPIFDPTFRRPFADQGFLGLGGGSELKQYVLTLNLMFTPWQHVSVVPAVRVERNDIQGAVSYTETDLFDPRFLTPFGVTSDQGFLDLAEQLEVRYTGLTNWIMYARGDWDQGDGDLAQREAAAGGVLSLSRDTDFARLTQKYTVGANYYPFKRLSLGAQYYHKKRDDDFNTQQATYSNTDGLYPGFINANNFDTDDMNFRVTWRPRNGLSIVSRYDFQLSSIDMAPNGGPGHQTAEESSHIIAETVTWSPSARLYLQGGGNYVLDRTDTPAANSFGAKPVILNAKNDYWTANGTVGYALSQKTDLQATYFYYRANDYQDNSQFSLPYGAGAEEHGVTASVMHRLKKNILCTLRYGFYQNRDQLAGGFNNYTAHLVYSSMQYRF